MINPFANEPVVDVAPDARVASVTSDEVSGDANSDDVEGSAGAESRRTESGNERAWAIGSALAIVAAAVGATAWYRIRHRPTTTQDS